MYPAQAHLASNRGKALANSFPAASRVATDTRNAHVPAQPERPRHDEV